MKIGIRPRRGSRRGRVRAYQMRRVVDLHEVRKLPSPGLSLSLSRSFFRSPCDGGPFRFRLTLFRPCFAAERQFSFHLRDARAHAPYRDACVRACTRARTHASLGCRYALPIHLNKRRAPFFRSAMHNEQRKSNRSCIYLFFSRSSNDRGPRFALCFIQIVANHCGLKLGVSNVANVNSESS